MYVNFIKIINILHLHLIARIITIIILIYYSFFFLTICILLLFFVIHSQAYFLKNISIGKL